MPLITKKSVEEIRSRADIVAFIGDYTNLRRAGAKWRGLSPFANEKTPSFYVDPDKGFYYCFSTGQGGDIFKFLMARENLTFAESVERVARRFGIPIEYEAGGNARAERSVRGELFEIHEFAAAYFKARFDENSPLAAQVREYWTRDRGFDAGTARDFRIGFLPPKGSREFAAALSAKGFSPRTLAASGIFVGTSRAAEPTLWRSRFEARLIIPICDIQGRVIAFTARKIPGITPDDGGMNDAKYINSSETEIFHKGSTLFNIDKAKEIFAQKRATNEPGGAAKTRNTPFVLVEGQLDAIRCSICGIRTAVAGQGTGITDEQLQLLHRYSDRLDCLLDADAAGQKAALRLAPIAFRVGLDLRFLSVPGGKDPDEFLARNGAGGVPAILGSAVPAVAYIAKKFFPEGGKKLPVAQRQAAFKEIFEIISASASDVFRAECVAVLARAAGTEQLALGRDFERFLKLKAAESRSRAGTAFAAPQDAAGTSQNAPERDDSATVEAALLQLCLGREDVAATLAEIVPADWIDTRICAGRILGRIFAEIAEGEWRGNDSLHDLLENDEESNCVARLRLEFGNAESAETPISEIEERANTRLAELCAKACKREQREIDRRIAVLPPDSPEIRTLMSRKIELRKYQKNPPRIALAPQN